MKFRLIKTDSAENPFLRILLRENIIGTPGRSMVYQHQKVDEKLDHIADPHFVSVGLRNVLLGTCCFCKREVIMQGKLVEAYYIRYFTFKNKFRSAPAIAKNPRRPSALKDEIHQLLKGELFGDSNPHLYYAYIDPDNLRSLRLAKDFGFSKAGDFRTVFYSRFFPKRSAFVSRIQPDEEPTVVGLLKDFYGDHHFLSFENVFHLGNYFVYKREGVIVAGIQALSEHWRVLELPGSNGKLLLGVLSRLPLMKRLISKDFRFLSVEAIYCKKGEEDALNTLLEDVLARFQVHSAIFCLDPGSEAYQAMQKLNRGLLGRLSKERSFAVMAKAQEMELELRSPCYVSAFDVM